MNTIKPMKKRSRWSWLVAASLLVAVAGDLPAQTITAPPANPTSGDRAPRFPENSDRAYGREFSFFLREFTSPNLTVKSIYVLNEGTYDGVIKIKPTTTFGFAVGYSLSERLNINADISQAKAQYTGVWGPNNVHGKGKLWLGNLNVDYSILKRHFTPYVSAGIGYLHFNPNVPSGDTTDYAWWNEWWGVSGDSSTTPTHTAGSFTWNAAAGLRWDKSESFFLKASCQLIWSAIGASGTYAFPQYTLNAGWRW